MKQFISRWAYAYAIVNIVFLFTAFVILRRLNIDVAYLKVSIGAIIISLFIACSITIFKAKNLNSLIRTIGGFVAILPIIFTTRKIFGVLVFRYSAAIFIFALICAIIYALAVLVVTKQFKEEEKSLNQLLTRKQSELKNDEEDRFFVE